MQDNHSDNENHEEEGSVPVTEVVENEVSIAPFHIAVGLYGKLRRTCPTIQFMGH